MVTYNASLSIHVDGEDVRLLPVVAAHTDGDTVVSFPGHDSELPSVDAEKLLAGEELPADASPQARALGSALAGLRASALPSELQDEKGVLATIRAGEKGQLPAQGARGALSARSGLKVAAYARRQRLNAHEP